MSDEDETDKVYAYLREEQLKFFDRTCSYLIEKYGPDKAVTYLLGHYVDLVAQFSVKSCKDFDATKEKIQNAINIQMTRYHEMLKEQNGTI